MDPTLKHKAGIGAIGGLSLSILKLIEAKFFISNLFSQDAIAAYLTYFCYVVLGVFVAIIFTETEQPTDKIRKHAFVLGLLAPSFLLAVVSQPIRKFSDVDPSLKGIQQLGSWLADSAYAQEVEVPKSPKASTSPNPPSGFTLRSNDDSVKTQAPPAAPGYLNTVELKKSDADYTFTDSVFRALGREGSPGPYLYVVAKSDDTEKAAKAASEINMILPKGEVKAFVVKPEGAKTLYVVLTPPASAAEATKASNVARNAALEALQKSAKPDTKRAAALLLEGEVVRARLLFE
jgi:hypothetical protein